jgi:hypothetical protein
MFFLNLGEDSRRIEAADAATIESENLKSFHTNP